MSEQHMYLICKECFHCVCWDCGRCEHTTVFKELQKKMKLKQEKTKGRFISGDQ